MEKHYSVQPSTPHHGVSLNWITAYLRTISHVAALLLKLNLYILHLYTVPLLCWGVLPRASGTNRAVGGQRLVLQMALPPAT